MSEDAALPLSFGLPREAAPARPRSEPSASRPEPPSTARPAPLGEFLSFAAAPPLPAAPSAWDADDEVCRDETNWCEARRFGGNGAALLLHEEILDYLTLKNKVTKFVNQSSVWEVRKAKLADLAFRRGDCCDQ